MSAHTHICTHRYKQVTKQGQNTNRNSVYSLVYSYPAVYTFSLDWPVGTQKAQALHISKWFLLVYAIPENQVKNGLSRPSIFTALDSWLTELTVGTWTPRSPWMSACLKAEARALTSQRSFRALSFSFSDPVIQCPATQLPSSVGRCLTFWGWMLRWRRCWGGIEKQHLAFRHLWAEHRVGTQ